MAETNVAIEFYNHPQIRDSQDGLLGMAVRGEGILGELCGASVGMTTQFRMQSAPALEDFLKQYRVRK